MGTTEFVEGIYGVEVNGVCLSHSAAENMVAVLPGKWTQHYGKEYRIVRAYLRSHTKYDGEIVTVCEELPAQQTANVYTMHNCSVAERQISTLEADNLALREMLQAYQALADRVEDSVSAESDGYLAFSFDWLRERSHLARKTDTLLNQKVEA